MSVVTSCFGDVEAPIWAAMVAFGSLHAVNASGFVFEND